MRVSAEQRGSCSLGSNRVHPCFCAPLGLIPEKGLWFGPGLGVLLFQSFQPAGASLEHQEKSWDPNAQFPRVGAKGQDSCIKD